MERVEKMVAEEGGYYVPEEKKEETKTLDKNQNPTTDVRELGARPKQNFELGLNKTMEVEPLSSKWWSYQGTRGSKVQISFLKDTSVVYYEF